MNLVLDDVDEINVKTHFKKNIGKILLKGDNITVPVSNGPIANCFNLTGSSGQAFFSVKSIWL